MKRITLFSLFASQIFCQQALVVSEVADLVGHPQRKAGYTLPVAPVSWRDKISCPRLHQSIFNETVEILEAFGKEAKVAISNAFYQTHSSKKKANQYWAERKHFITFDQLKKRGIDISLLPKPISFKQEFENSLPTIVLVKPFFESGSKRMFSAGTRFVTKSGKAQILDPVQMSFSQIAIPKEYFIEEKPRTDTEKRKLSCKILEFWASQQYIPYVWGGTSFTKKTGKDFEIKTDGKKQYFTMKGYADNPKAGFDCSGVILRAAQIAGLPYYFKNTLTIELNLKQVKTKCGLKDGSVIVWPGHVVVLTNAAKGTIVESGGQDYGYGYLHKLPIGQYFKGINSAEQLLDAYKNKKPLFRLDPDKKVVQKIKEFKIYSL